MYNPSFPPAAERVTSWPTRRRESGQLDLAASRAGQSAVLSSHTASICLFEAEQRQWHGTLSRSQWSHGAHVCQLLPRTRVTCHVSLGSSDVVPESCVKFKDYYQLIVFKVIHKHELIPVLWILFKRYFKKLSTDLDRKLKTIPRC